jgi:hypothetical protein
VNNLAKYQQVYRPVYSEILVGFSVFEASFLEGGSAKKYYIKHLKEIDYGELESRTAHYETQAREKGLLTESEHLKSFDEMGIWTQNEEVCLENLKNEVQNLNAQIADLVVKSQREELEKELKEKQKKLEDLILQRGELLTITVGSYVSKKKSEEILRSSFYNDPKFKKLCFTEDDYGELTHGEYASLVSTFNEKMSLFSDYHISRLALLPFFINGLFISKSNPFIFYGKPVVELTVYQAELFSKGMFYKSVLEQGHDPPNEFYDDLDKLISWYDLKSKSKAGPQDVPSGSGNVRKVSDAPAQGKSYVGASKEEMVEIAKAQGLGTLDLQSEAEKLKKELGKDHLDIHDMAKLHGL